MRNQGGIKSNDQPLLLELILLKKKIQINWQFSIEKARSKMTNQYNKIYTKTYFTMC